MSGCGKQKSNLRSFYSWTSEFLLHKWTRAAHINGFGIRNVHAEKRLWIVKMDHYDQKASPWFRINKADTQETDDTPLPMKAFEFKSIGHGERGRRIDRFMCLVNFQKPDAGGAGEYGRVAGRERYQSP